MDIAKYVEGAETLYAIALGMPAKLEAGLRDEFDAESFALVSGRHPAIPDHSSAMRSTADPDIRRRIEDMAEAVTALRYAGADRFKLDIASGCFVKAHTALLPFIHPPDAIGPGNRSSFQPLVFLADYRSLAMTLALINGGWQSACATLSALPGFYNEARNICHKLFQQSRCINFDAHDIPFAALQGLRTIAAFTEELWRKEFEPKYTMQLLSDAPQAANDQMRELEADIKCHLNTAELACGVQPTPSGFGRDGEPLTIAYSQQQQYAAGTMIVPQPVAPHQHAPEDRSRRKLEQVSNLTPTEESIVQALREHGPMKGEDLAKASDNEYNGHFKVTLSNMKKRGIIDNTRGLGYHFPDSQS